MMMVNPANLAEHFRSEIRDNIVSLGKEVVLTGLLASSDDASHTYSQYMKAGCEKVGVKYQELNLKDHQIEDQLIKLNQDEDVTGVIVFYPIYGGEKDRKLRTTLSPLKDVEGLHSFWLTKLYANERLFEFKGKNVKALLPCTPLAIVKLLDSVDLFDKNSLPCSGKVVSIFNRSEVVGRPLAHMLANDGAQIFSFDIENVVEFSANKEERVSTISREDALKNSDIVITGVPHSNFNKVRADELKNDVVCLNFSSFENFENDVKDRARIFIPRVGPVTVAMCLRNLVRMAQSFSD